VSDSQKHALKLGRFYGTTLMQTGSGQIPAKTPTLSLSSLLHRVKPTIFPSATVVSAD